MTLRNMGLDKTSIKCLVGRSFVTECFCVKTGDFAILEDTIHSAESASG